MKIIVIFLMFIIIISLASSQLQIFGKSSNNVIDLSSIPDKVKDFLDLLDTPSTYSGQGGNCVLVTPGETSLGFGSCGSGGGGDFSFTDFFDSFQSNFSEPWTQNYSVALWSYNQTDTIFFYNQTITSNIFNQELNDTEHVVFNSTLLNKNLTVQNKTNILFLVDSEANNNAGYIRVFSNVINITSVSMYISGLPQKLSTEALSFICIERSPPYRIKQSFAECNLIAL